MNRADLSEQLARLKVELNDVKTATMISESGRQDEVQTLQRKYSEEVASLQLLMKGALTTSLTLYFSIVMEL